MKKINDDKREAQNATLRFQRKRKKKCKFRFKVSGVLKKAVKSLRRFTYCVRDVQEVSFFKVQLVWLENNKMRQRYSRLISHGGTRSLM